MSEANTMLSISQMMDHLAQSWNQPDAQPQESDSLASFQEVTGVALSEFIQNVPFSQARELLKKPSLDRANNITVVPLQPEPVTWGFHNTALGRLLLAMQGNAVCWLGFTTKGDGEARQAFEKAFQGFSLTENAAALAPKTAHLLNPKASWTIALRGTPFQMAVWQELSRIPFGTVTTYGRIAAAIQNPKAVRAVGRAVGANPVGFLIPCHRVIQFNGAIHNYAAGPLRKRVILAWEAAKLLGIGLI